MPEARRETGGRVRRTLRDDGGLARISPISEMADVVFERRGQRLLDGLSFSVSPFGTTVLMGPNGAGKSLTLRMLAGLLMPDAGKVRWRGAPRPAPRSVALVFQKPVLLRRSVRSNLAHALALLKVPRRGRPERLASLVEMGGLESLVDRPARSLSGGEQQRVALVRALAASPSLLLLDEPTASLDPRSTAAIESLVQRAVEAGTKVVMVTHDAGQAQRVGDEITFVHKGRVSETTPVSQFFDAPMSRPARDYLEGRLLL